MESVGIENVACAYPGMPGVVEYIEQYLLLKQSNQKGQAIVINHHQRFRKALFIINPPHGARVLSIFSGKGSQFNHEQGGPCGPGKWDTWASLFQGCCFALSRCQNLGNTVYFNIYYKHVLGE